jgi:hypothetical protein
MIGRKKGVDCIGRFQGLWSIRANEREEKTEKDSKFPFNLYNQSVFSFQPLQHPLEPNLVILNMEVTHFAVPRRLCFNFYFKPE